MYITISIIIIFIVWHILLHNKIILDKHKDNSKHKKLILSLPISILIFLLTIPAIPIILLMITVNAKHIKNKIIKKINNGKPRNNDYHNQNQ